MSISLQTTVVMLTSKSSSEHSFIPQSSTFCHFVNELSLRILLHDAIDNTQSKEHPNEHNFPIIEAVSCDVRMHIYSPTVQLVQSQIFTS